MLYQIEPALAARLADKIRAARQQLRHRMIEATHQRAVDEQAVGYHGLFTPQLFRDGASAPDLRCAIAHRGISRFRVRCFASPRNDEVWIASSRSLSSGPPKAGPVGSSQ